MSRVVSNALDFLNMAIDSFESQPKYSIINFYSAVELFLKARLLHEHWSLVVAKDPDRQNFDAGDFQSVTFEEAFKRLKNILQSPLPEPARESFDAIRKHRNKMVHFFHEADRSTASIEAIAAEQLRAWYQLNALVLGQWRSVFSDLTSEFSQIEKKLSRHKEYLNAKFVGLSPELERLVSEGTDIAICPSCAFKAAERVEILDGLFKYACKLCRHQASLLDYECPSCHTVAQIDDGVGFICAGCGHSDSEEELIGRLVGVADSEPANCYECTGYHTVIEYDGKYLCLHCFEVSDEVRPCGFCGEPSNGDLGADSYLTGCGICDGQAGWMMGKND